MNGFAPDTNIISFAIKGNQCVERHLQEEALKKTSLVIPPFVYYELKRGYLRTKATQRIKQLDAFCAKMEMGQTNDEVFEEAARIDAELAAKKWNIGDVDIFIAAWCKVYGYTLVTNNTKHFGKIDGLSIVDWSLDTDGDGAEN